MIFQTELHNQTHYQQLEAMTWHEMSKESNDSYLAEPVTDNYYNILKLISNC